MKKKAKAVKGKPAGRMLTKTEPCASFFNFFSPPVVPENPNEADEDEMEELQQAMEEDYELGCAPGRPGNPLSYIGRGSGYAACRRAWGALRSIKSSALCWIKARSSDLYPLWHRVHALSAPYKQASTTQ